MLTRTLLLLALSLALVGCTRYTTTRAQGPFGKKSAIGAPATGYASVPIAPRSPLAIAGAPDPTPPGPPGDNPAVPPRPPVVGNLASNTPQPSGIVQTGGIAPYTPEPEEFAGLPPRRRREPKPEDLPSPFAPKQPATPLPTAPANPGVPVPNPNPAPVDENLTQLKRLMKLATDRWAIMESYETHLVRREMVGGKMTPPDDCIMQFRKQPFSVYMKFIGEAGKGREVVYVQGMYKDEMQILTGAGDLIKGIKVARSPDDPEVMKRSRHSIRDAGYDKTLGILAKQIELLESGKLPPGTIRYVGPTKRPEHGDKPLELVVRTVGPKEDPLLDGGGAWSLWFDAQPDSPSYGLPVVLILQDARGGETEYICYDRFRGPLKLGDADFSPERFGKKK